MVYHTGRAALHGSSARKIVITESSILDTTLDMNGRNITSVRNPTRPLDAANKFYVDETTARVAEEIKTQTSGVEVTLTGIEFVNVVNLQSGSYFLTVRGIDGGPTACFSVSKTHESSAAQVSRVSNQNARTSETLEVDWPRSGLLRLRKTGLGYDGQYVAEFSSMNLSSVPAPPTLPSDTATKEYVDWLVTQRLDVKFGGVNVALHGTEPQNVSNLQFGSYMMTVSPQNIDGAPTATFSISKTAMGEDADCKTLSYRWGRYTPEELVLSWPPNSMVQLHKTGPGYDGTYLVNLDFKNFSSVPLPMIPSDTATVSYVNEQIQRHMQQKFGGHRVYLEDDRFAPIFHMRHGSYIICISSKIPHAPCATFNISKNSQDSEPSIVQLSMKPGRETQERLEIAWPRDSMILLRKTGVFYNGEYIAEIPSKNISVASEVILDSDVASKDYVADAMRNYIEAKQSGVQVELTDSKFAPVAAMRTGSCLITVSAPQMDGAPTAAFLVSKSTMRNDAAVFRVTHSPGFDTMETIDIIWPGNSRLQVRKTGLNYDGMYIVDFNIKNFTATQEPVVPTDLATRAYVDRIVSDRMTAKFEGISITLFGTTQTPVCAQRCGTYFVSVNPTFDGGPSASFHVSKSSIFEEANVAVASSCDGRDTHETLHLSWPANEKMRVEKDGFQYDGVYIVNMNLKNFSSSPPAVFPSDVVDKAYVDSVLAKRDFVKTFTTPTVGHDLGFLPASLYTGLLYNFDRDSSDSFTFAKQQPERTVSGVTFQWTVDNHVLVSGITSDTWTIKIY